MLCADMHQESHTRKALTNCLDRRLGAHQHQGIFQFWDSTVGLCNNYDSPPSRMITKAAHHTRKEGSLCDRARDTPVSPTPSRTCPAIPFHVVSVVDTFCGRIDFFVPLINVRERVCVRPVAAHSLSCATHTSFGLASTYTYIYLARTNSFLLCSSSFSFGLGGGGVI